MESRLSAPDTLFEWQVLGVSVFVLSLLVTYAVSLDLLYAISVGLRVTIGSVVVLLLIAFAIRRLQDTQNTHE